MADLPPDSELLIEERLAKYRQISKEHSERDPKSGFSFAVKPDYPVGMKAVFRLSDENLEKALGQELLGKWQDHVFRQSHLTCT